MLIVRLNCLIKFGVWTSSEVRGSRERTDKDLKTCFRCKLEIENLILAQNFLLPGYQR